MNNNMKALLNGKMALIIVDKCGNYHMMFSDKADKRKQKINKLYGRK